MGPRLRKRVGPGAAELAAPPPEAFSAALAVGDEGSAGAGDGEQGDGAERGDHDRLLSLGRDAGWAMCSQLSLSAVPHSPISMVPSWQHPLTLPLRVSYGFVV